jgi:hypothetical protein
VYPRIKKQEALVLRYDSRIKAPLPQMQESFLRWICLVAKPSTAGRRFVADVQHLARRISDDISFQSSWALRPS